MSLRLHALAAGGLLWAAGCSAFAAAEAEFEYLPVRGRPVLEFNSNGAVLAWAGQLEMMNPALAPAGEIRYGEKIFKLNSPQISRSKDELVFSYRWSDNPELRVVINHELAREHGATVWRREIQIQGPTHLSSDLAISLQSWPALPQNTWLPLINGTGAELGTNQSAAFRFAGALPGKGAWLALPLVSIPTPNEKGHILIAADPYFSTLFRSNTIEWTYPAKGSLENGIERRTLVVASHGGSVDESISDFFELMLPDVAPGPKWLHEIALVDFDYLSDAGRGWFNDINALTSALPKKDHHQAFLCVHGCYDFLGRYSFNANTRKLDREWIAFSSYELARNAHPYGTIGGDRVPMGFTNCKPQPMSLAEIHRRLRYARSRGCRAGLYFADGLNAGEGLPDFTPDRVLHWGGWQGPDSKGKSYIQNPLHPKVRAFFLDYTKAMLDEFGPDMDGLVWDETFHIPCGQLGTDAWPGYADRAMMRLTRDITAMVDDYNRRHGRQIAFLTSDCLGAVVGDEFKAPYALVSHGTYQDSWCQPHAWSYGLFANYRNVLWSCCWWPISKWPWVEFGVREYQAPVSLSNGWGDDTGFSEMLPAQQARVIELFNWRKQHPTKLKWFDYLPTEPAQPARN